MKQAGIASVVVILGAVAVLMFTFGEEIRMVTVGN